MPNPPKRDPVGRRPRVGPVVLPAEGRQGDPPDWPLSEPSLAEVGAWWQLWAMPQAVMWERQNCVRVVARYCRVVVEAESRGETSAALLAQVVAMETQLGLTPKAMRLLLWEIAPNEVGAQRQQRQDSGEDELARRRRLLGEQAAS